MPPATGQVAAGLLALTALLLLPGLVVVRSPWPFVPFFSVSFWVVSWGWLAPAGPGRERFLEVALVSWALLAALRLLKPLGASWPSGPVAAVLVAALARLAPLAVWPGAPGLDAGFSSACTLLLTWRDGIPASFQPLYPFSGFGTGEFGLVALAADIALLSGLPPHRAFLLAALVSEGLLVLALFAAARRYASAGTAAIASLMAGALGLAALADREGGSGVVLAVALAIPGAALVLRSEGRAPSVAGGLFWAAALCSLGLPRAIVPALLVATLLLTARGRPARPRLGLAAGVAVLLAAPALWRTAESVSLSIWRPLATALLVGVVAGAAAVVRWGERTWSSRQWVAAGVGAVALAATLGDWARRSARVEVAPDLLAVAGWVQDNSRPLDRLCSDDEAVRAWMAALAARAVDPPRIPGWIRVRPVEGGTSPCLFQVSRKGAPSSPFVVSFRSGDLTLSRRLPARVEGPR